MRTDRHNHENMWWGLRAEPEDEPDPKCFSLYATYKLPPKMAAPLLEELRHTHLHKEWEDTMLSRAFCISEAHMPYVGIALWDFRRGRWKYFKPTEINT
jgi:hypothetical protein